MARCVSDVALMLDAGAGHETDDPLSFDEDGTSFLQEIGGGELPKRVAFSRDLGIVPMERQVADICQRAADQFRNLGAEVTDEIPDFTGVLGGFTTFSTFALESTVMLRAGDTASGLGYLAISVAAGVALAATGLLAGEALGT